MLCFVKIFTRVFFVFLFFPTLPMHFLLEQLIYFDAYVKNYMKIGKTLYILQKTKLHTNLITCIIACKHFFLENNDFLHKNEFRSQCSQSLRRGKKSNIKPKDVWAYQKYEIGQREMSLNQNRFWHLLFVCCIADTQHYWSWS